MYQEEQKYLSKLNKQQMCPFEDFGTEMDYCNETPIWKQTSLQLYDHKSIAGDCTTQYNADRNMLQKQRSNKLHDTQVNRTQYTLTQRGACCRSNACAPHTYPSVRAATTMGLLVENTRLKKSVAAMTGNTAR